MRGSEEQLPLKILEIKLEMFGHELRRESCTEDVGDEWQEEDFLNILRSRNFLRTY